MILIADAIIKRSADIKANMGEVFGGVASAIFTQIIATTDDTDTQRKLLDTFVQICRGVYENGQVLGNALVTMKDYER